MLKNIRVFEASDLKWVQTFAMNELRAMEAENQGNEAFPAALIDEGFRRGLFQLPGPKNLGGQELDVSSLIWVIRRISSGSAGFAATFIGNLLGLSAVMLYGSEELKSRVLNQKSLNSLWSFGMTEAEAGSDLQSIATNAKQTKDGFVLNGEKNFITNASYSKQMVVFAREYDEAGKDLGISCFYVDAAWEGFERGKAYSKTAWRKANTASLIFKDVKLSPDARLGQAGAGLRILTHCLNRSKTLLGAMGVGIADRALELATERLDKTERFGKPLIEQPAIRHHIAQAAIQRDAAWLLTQRAAATWDEGLDATLESSMAKHFSGKMATAVTSEAIELFGARGLFTDFEVSRLWNDAKAIEIIEGPSLVQELLVARSLMPLKQRRNPELYVLRKDDLKKAAS